MPEPRKIQAECGKPPEKPVGLEAIPEIHERIHAFMRKYAPLEDKIRTENKNGVEKLKAVRTAKFMLVRRMRTIREVLRDLSTDPRVGRPITNVAELSSLVKEADAETPAYRSLDRDSDNIQRAVMLALLKLSGHPQPTASLIAEESLLPAYKRDTGQTPERRLIDDDKHLKERWNFVRDSYLKIVKETESEYPTMDARRPSGYAVLFHRHLFSHRRHGDLAMVNTAVYHELTRRREQLRS